jgi:hypothetical protein
MSKFYKKLFSYFVVLLLLSTFALAQPQNVGIGTTNPHSSALLDLDVSAPSFTTKLGFLVPRMTLAQRTAIPSPATGLLVYQTDAVAGFYYYTGSGWVRIVDAGTDNLFLLLSGGTMSGNINMNNNIITNIGNAGTNFLSNGGLTLANTLTVSSGGITVSNGGINITGNSTINGTLTGLTGLTSSGVVAFTSLAPFSVVKTAAGGQLTTGNVSLTTDVTGTLSVARGGTGLGTAPTNGQLLIGNGTGYTLNTLTAGSNININNAAGSITISATGFEEPLSFNAPLSRTGNSVSIASNSATSAGVVAAGGGNPNKVWKTDANGVPDWRDESSSGLTAGTGIDITNGIISNTAPDQVITLTPSGVLSITGTYPNFNLSTPNFGTTSGTIAEGNHTHSLSSLTANNWQMFYSNGSGQITGFGLGTNGQFLQSTGANSAPQWASILLLPNGSNHQTLRFSGGNWVTSDFMHNHGNGVIFGNFATSINNPGAVIHQDMGTNQNNFHKFTGGTLTGIGTNDGFDIGIEANGNAVIKQWEDLNIQFYTNNVERFRIYKTGHIGMGKSSIAYSHDSLDVQINGDLRVTGDLIVDGNIDPIALIFQPRNSPPGTLYEGMMYYDNNSKNIRVRSNNKWLDLASTNDSTSHIISRKITTDTVATDGITANKLTSDSVSASNLAVGKSNASVSAEINGAIALNPDPQIATSSPINVGNRSYIKINFGGTFQITNGVAVGQILILHKVGGGNSTLPNAGNCKLGGGLNWLCTINDTITLIWDGQFWVELTRNRH